VDPQRPAERHRVGDDRRPLRDARPEDHDRDEAAIIAEADTVGKRVWAAVEKAGAITIPRLPRPK
jgi:hypothetical protein